jgi:type II secretory pathway predicted ATPase ExeA
MGDIQLLHTRSTCNILLQGYTMLDRKLGYVRLKSFSEFERRIEVT